MLRGWKVNADDLSYPMFTASKLYPSLLSQYRSAAYFKTTSKSRTITYPGGTAGKTRVMVPLEGDTLLAIANAWLKIVLTSSSEKVLGSPAAFVQVIVAEPPDERFSGVLSVRAEMRGTSIKTLPPKVRISPSRGYIRKPFNGLILTQT
jgi:hypothetical protein